MVNLFGLTDAQMARLQQLLPKGHGKPRVDGSRILSGITFINCNGLWWYDAIRKSGPPKTLCRRWTWGSDKATKPCSRDRKSRG